jgi:hypothetical protein
MLTLITDIYNYINNYFLTVLVITEYRVILYALPANKLDFTKYYYVTQYYKPRKWNLGFGNRQNHNEKNCDEFFDCFEYRVTNVRVEWFKVLSRNLEF